MDAFHIYYQKNVEQDKYDVINYLVQLASISFWKKNQGKIHLYCNKNHLRNLEIWGIDSLYDSINVDCLENIPYSDYLEKYWSFCKIHAIKEIAEEYTEFVVIDTDLWIQEPIKIDNNFQLICYHEENVSEHPSNPYVNQTNFLSDDDCKLIDWSMNPMNCAFLYLNSKDLVNDWYKWVVKVIERNKQNEILDCSADTIFIEQRLLSSIAHTLKMKIGKLIPNVYQPHIKSDHLGSEWEPKVGFDLENQYINWNIKHVWGLKKSYDDADIRSLVLSTVISSLDTFVTNWSSGFDNLRTEINEIQKMNDLETTV